MRLIYCGAYFYHNPVILPQQPSSLPDSLLNRLAVLNARPFGAMHSDALQRAVGYHLLFGWVSPQSIGECYQYDMSSEFASCDKQCPIYCQLGPGYAHSRTVFGRVLSALFHFNSYEK